MAAVKSAEASVADDYEHKIESELMGPRPRTVRESLSRYTGLMVGTALAFAACVGVCVLASDILRILAGLGACLAAVLFAFVALARWMLVLSRARLFLRDGIPTVATVTQRRYDTILEQHVVSYRWRTKTGRELREEVRVFDFEYRRYPAGAKFTVLYLPEDPSEGFPYFKVKSTYADFKIIEPRCD